MYSYHDCYKILSIESSCDWPGVRKAYRQKIQKWHPDRITDAAIKSSAEDKLKELNLAYEQLSVYYKMHGYLPVQEIPRDVVADKVEAKPARSRPQSKSVPKTDKESDRNNGGPGSLNISNPSNLLSLLVFTVIGLALYTLLDIESPEDRSTQDIDSSLLESSRSTGNFKLGEQDGITTDAKLKSSDDEKNSHTEEDDSHIRVMEYFTIGSSVKDVLRIQGMPDSVVDNIWFYGESTIKFEDGVVKDWKRTAASPLKAHMDL